MRIPLTKLFVVISKNPTSLNKPVQNVFIVETRLREIVVDLVLFYGSIFVNLFKLTLQSHLTLLILLKNQLSIIWPLVKIFHKIFHKVLHQSIKIVVSDVEIRWTISFVNNALVSLVGKALIMVIIVHRKSRLSLNRILVSIKTLLSSHKLH